MKPVSEASVPEPASKLAGVTPPFPPPPATAPPEVLPAAQLAGAPPPPKEAMPSAWASASVAACSHSLSSRSFSSACGAAGASYERQKGGLGRKALRGEC